MITRSRPLNPLSFDGKARSRTGAGHGGVPGVNAMQGWLRFGAFQAALVTGLVMTLLSGLAWGAGEDSFTLVKDTGGIERVHVFTANGSFKVPEGVENIEYLVVGGGGGGGGGSSAGGGGGGAGGFNEDSATVVPGATYEVHVGSGGSWGRGGESARYGGDGGDSWIQAEGGADLVRSQGGGGGARGEIYEGNVGNPGGSGGGGSRWSSGGSGTAGGNDGGGGGDLGPGSSGGGGAAEPGKSESGDAGGDGGAGQTSTITGRERVYAGGGGGGNRDSGTRSHGGDGGGGRGGHWDNGWRGQSAAANTGGGGGGGGGTVSWWNPDGNNGGSGGSGIVVVRYTLPAEPDYEERTIGDDTVHIYRGTGAHDFTVPNDVTEVEYLVVGGGGAGASVPSAGQAARGTGGGGAGAFQIGRMDVTPGEALSLNVGAGGSVEAGHGQGENGEDSWLAEVIASGGGGGGSVGSDGGEGGSGGGGGGRSDDFDACDGAVGGAGIRGAGFSGGQVTCSAASGNAAGGGGGGAGGVGEPGFVTASFGGGGDGGPGLVSRITGEARWYAGGGGGGATDGQDSSPDGGLGGLGGGGAGTGDDKQGEDAQSGLPNTGGGGGGIGRNGTDRATLGGAGGSGIVVVRYTRPDEQQQDDTAGVEIEAISTVTSSGPAPVPISLSGFDGAQSLVAVLSLSDNGGTLSLVDTNGLTSEFGFGELSDPAQTLSFRGARADVEAALAEHVRWNAPLQATEPALQVSVTEAAEGAFFNAANGHYYRAVDAGPNTTTWQQARDAAAEMTLFGMSGYLATVTSAQENEFVASNTDGTDIWIGASDDLAEINAVCDASLYAQQGEFGVSSGSNYDSGHQQNAEGRWYWVTGPEACSQFWHGEAKGSPVGGGFAFWDAGEPNNSNGENFGATNRPDKPGRWNDFGFDNADANDYLVEFGGMPGEQSTAAQASATRTLRASDQIVIEQITASPGEESVPVGITLPEPVTSSENELIAGVSVPAAGGTLVITKTEGLSLSFGFDSFRNESAINFSGSPADVVAGLNSLEWNAPGGAAQIELTVSVSERVADHFYNSENGHYYLVVNTGKNWEAARDDARTRTLFGMTGYLATITSEQENAFISENVEGSNIWIGASDHRDFINEACAETRYSAQYTGPQPAEGNWYWATGPEACTPFWEGEADGDVVAERFASWAAGEPNDSGGEHVAATNWNNSSGEWNDLDPTRTESYLVEFGGRPNETSTAIQARGTGTLAAVETSKPDLFDEEKANAADNPYQITSADELAWIQNDPEGFYELTGDVDLDGVDWQPIGSADTPFTGSLKSADGGAASITGLDGKPLFDELGPGAELSGLTIAGSVNDDAEEGSGLLANRIKGDETDSVKLNDITIDTESRIDGGENDYIGGLAGSVQYAELTDTTIDGDVLGRNYVGGVAGEISDSTLDHTEVNGDTSGHDYVGGVGGTIKDSELRDTTVTGGVHGEGSNVGSVGGQINRSDNANCVLERVRSEGNVSGGNKTGGVGGSIDGCTVDDVEVNGDVSGKDDTGGIGGEMNDTEVNDANVKGNVSGDKRVGGIGGDVKNGRVDDSRVEGDVTGNEEVGDLYGREENVATTGVVAGEGTEDSPYRVTHGDHLAWLDDHPDAHFVIDGGDNRELTVGSDWEPIGTDMRFTGNLKSVDGRPVTIKGLNGKPVFDRIGAGARVSDLAIANSVNDNADEGSGLFANSIEGENGNLAEISNIVIDGGSRINGGNSNNIGGLAGTIDHARLDRITMDADVNGGERVGGIGGEITNSDISEGFVNGDVSGNAEVGGIGGNVRDSKVSDSLLTGDVSEGDQEGGLYGHEENVDTSRVVAGSGTEASPYRISQAEHLSLLNGEPDGHFVITEDLDMAELDNWQPIGDAGEPFTGNLKSEDGEKRTISGLGGKPLFGQIGAGAEVSDLNIAGSVNDNADEGSGLFADAIKGENGTPAELRNITVDAGSSIDGGDDDYIGGLAGTIHHASLRDVTIDGDVTGRDYVGGLGGEIGDSELTDTTIGGNTKGRNHVGGVGGRINNATLNRTVVDGDTAGNDYVGGVGGSIEDTDLTDTTVNGGVHGEGSNVGSVGGQINRSENASCVLNTIRANGSVSGGNKTGGVGGSIDGCTVSDVEVTGSVTGEDETGGVGGTINGSAISDATIEADVAGDDHVGGIGGRIDNSTVSGSTVNGHVSASGENVGAISGSGEYEDDGGNDTSNAEVTAEALRFNSTPVTETTVGGEYSYVLGAEGGAGEYSFTLEQGPDWPAIGESEPTDAAVVVAGAKHDQGGTDEKLAQPLGIFVDGTGNLYIADSVNHRVQKWAPGAGQGDTVAGGNGGGAEANQLNGPWDIGVDSVGNIYVADAGNQRIQRWAPGEENGVTLKTGSNFNHLAIDENNDRIYTAAGGTLGVYNLEMTASPEFSTRLSDEPWTAGSLALDAARNLYVLDVTNERVQKFDPVTEEWSTVVEQLSDPDAITLDAEDNLYVGGDERVLRWEPGGAEGTLVAGREDKVVSPEDDPFLHTSLNHRLGGLAFDPDGRLYVGEVMAHDVVRIDFSPGQALTGTVPTTQGTHEVTLAVGDESEPSQEDTQSFTLEVVGHVVTASAGANGSVSPASQSLDHEASAEVSLTPDSGYAVDAVTGCGEGSLDGLTYTTGPVTDACEVEASFVRVANAGTGTADDPYVINDTADLAYIDQARDSHFVLDGGADGRLDVGENWEPIGSAAEPFTGSLKSHDVAPVILTGLDGKPLFDELGPGAEVSDLTIEGSINENADEVSGLFANRIQGADGNPVRVDNVTIDGGSRIDGGDNGFIGSLAGTIAHAELSGVIVDSDTSGNNNVGGVSGAISDSTLTDTTVNGDVTGNNNVAAVGGTIDDSSLTNTEINGEVQGSGTQVGGIGGELTNSEVHETRINGDITGEDYVGGIGGAITGGNISDIKVEATVTGDGDNVGTVGGSVDGTVIDGRDSDANGGGSGDDDSLSVQPVDSDGTPLVDGPIATGQEVHLPISGGVRPLEITGEVSRGNAIQPLDPDDGSPVVLADPDGGAAVLTVRDGDYYFSASRGGIYVLYFEDADAVTIRIEFEVRPQVAFTSIRQPATAGQKVVVRAVLEGTPGQYPVSVPYEVQGHGWLSASELTANGEFTFEADGEHERIRSFLLTPAVSDHEVRILLKQGAGPEHALLGDPAEHVVELRTADQVPLNTRLRMEQGGAAVDTVANRQDGAATISVRDPATSDMLSNQAHSFDWSRSSLELGVHNDAGPQVQVSPEGLHDGQRYVARVTVTERDAPGRQVQLEGRLIIVGDADGEAATAYREFTEDQALLRNRIPICPQGDAAFRDSGQRSCNQVDRSARGIFMDAPESYELRLGGMSEWASWQTQDFGLEMVFDEMVNDSGEPLQNSEDVLYRQIGFKVDFEIHGLDFPGQAVPVVVPLPEGKTIPDGAVWRKYHAGTGWQNFVEDPANRLHSSARMSGGDCPWPGSDRWQSGLNAGDACVRLIVEDGGPNDFDREADGIIRDPGSLAVLASSEDADSERDGAGNTLRSSGGGGGGAVDPWSLGGLLLLGLVMVFRRLMARPTALALLIIGALSATAQADDQTDDRTANPVGTQPGWYVGGQLGWAMTDVSSSDINRRLEREGIDGEASLEDADRPGLRLFLGYQVNHWLALESGITHFARMKTELRTEESVTIEELDDVRPGSAQGLDLTVTLGHDFSPRLRGFVRGGVFIWRARHDLTRGGSKRASGTDPVYGIGVEWGFTPSVAARLSWSRYRVESDNTDFLALGLIYRFGQQGR